MPEQINVNVTEQEAIQVKISEKEHVTVNISSVSGGIVSNPPGKHYRVTNLWVNKNTGKLHVDYEVP